MFYFLFCVCCLLGVVPILILVYSKSLNNSRTYKFQALLWLVFISSLYEFFGTSVLHLNSDIWFRTYILFEFSALFLFYFHLLKSKYQTFLFATLFLFIVSYSAALPYYNIWNKAEVESFFTVYETAFIYVASMLWFSEMFGIHKFEPLATMPEFYIVAGLLICFSGTVLLFLSIKVLATTSETFSQYWMVNLVFNIILRLMLIVSTWKVRQI
jgi:hypothetical protein